MRVNESLSIIELPTAMGGAVRTLNLSLIENGPHDVTVVDAGLPGSVDQILDRLHDLGYQASDVKRIFVTHHDIDHVGSLLDLQEKTGAEIYASKTERPYIEGEIPFQKASPERLAIMPQLKTLIEQYKPAKVDHVFEFGEILDVAGGVRAVGTPGHTAGHTSFYLQKTKTLIAGDAVTAENGHLNGPNEGATPDLSTAKDSVRDLNSLDVETIVAYHGGLVKDDVPGQLRRVTNES